MCIRDSSYIIYKCVIHVRRFIVVRRWIREKCFLLLWWRMLVCLQERTGNRMWRFFAETIFVCQLITCSKLDSVVIEQFSGRPWATNHCSHYSIRSGSLRPHLSMLCGRRNSTKFVVERKHSQQIGCCQAAGCIRIDVNLHLCPYGICRQPVAYL